MKKTMLSLTLVFISAVLFAQNLSKYNKVYEFNEKGFAKAFVGSVSIYDKPITGKYGLIDKTGKEIIPIEHDHIEVIEKLGIVKVFKGILDSGNPVKGKYGLMDFNGKELCPLKYDYIEFRIKSMEEYTIVEIAKIFVGETDEYGGPVKGKFGLIDKTGKELCPLKYDHIGAMTNEGILTAFIGEIDIFFGDTQNGKWGLLDKTGKELTPIMFDYLECYDIEKVYKAFMGTVTSEGKPKVGKYGLFDFNGKELTALKYDEIVNFIDKHAELTPVKLNEKWGFINKSGKEVTPLIYDEVANFRKSIFDISTGKKDADFNDLAAVKRDGKWGFINSSGKEIIACKFEDVYNKREEYMDVKSYYKGFTDNQALVLLDGKDIVIDKQGNYVRDVKWDNSASENNNKITQIKNAISGTTAEATVTQDGRVVFIKDGNGGKHQVREYVETQRVKYAQLNADKDLILLTNVNGNVSIIDLAGSDYSLVYVNTSSSASNNAKSAIWVTSKVEIEFQDGRITKFYFDGNKWKGM